MKATEIIKHLVKSGNTENFFVFHAETFETAESFARRICGDKVVAVGWCAVGMDYLVCYNIALTHEACDILIDDAKGNRIYCYMIETDY